MKQYIDPAAIDPLEYNGGLFKPEGWRRCSASSLRGHIVNSHLRPATLEFIGLPLFDVEVAKVRGFGLGWVVSKAVERLALTDEQIGGEPGNVNPDLHRERLAKTIRFIGDQGLADVPWEKIDEIFRGASEVTVDLAEDVHDNSLVGTLIKDDALWGYDKRSRTAQEGSSLACVIDGISSQPDGDLLHKTDYQVAL